MRVMYWDAKLKDFLQLSKISRLVSRRLKKPGKTRKRMKIITSKGDAFNVLDASAIEGGRKLLITTDDSVDMFSKTDQFDNLDFVKADGHILFGRSYYLSCTHYIDEKKYRIVLERMG